MSDAGNAAALARSFPAEVAIALLRHDVPDATPAELDAAADYVDGSLAGMAELTRLGVLLASGAVYVALSVLGRSRYRSQDPETRSRQAARLAGSPLPLLVEFSRMARGLALAGLFEHRSRVGALE